MNNLEMKDVWKSYKQRNKEEVTVLKGINMLVKQGDMVAIMGPSGSGKTTLLNIVSGIDCYDKGEIYIEDSDLSDLNKEEVALFRRRRLGMVFQDFNLIESLSAKENILLPMILEKRFADEQEEQAERILKILNIQDIQNKNIAEISGGQKQRVAIGRALINNPAIILADEPTGNLDSRSTKEVMDYFTLINQELTTSILLVTHDTFAASYCNKVVLLKDGVFKNEIDKKGSRKQFIDSITEMLAIIGGEQDDIL
ncbi:ABC transporter ATP-binding protein [Aminipila terrae]|uniref:ATP-binding cassette domain-containing protein n=1 Tax=Aminipila terrae TaxID=2697030 RepID=A0A6P1MF20_9FIRM|nr:ABC transporter ATP-binding protein [Aminipila terrae]QHI73309.1 ATP-binding cassette domain-containing protein [Aminipila terrae]